MAVYVSVVTDAFEEVMDAAKRDTRNVQNIRRPLRGIQVKKDTYSVIRVLTSTGREIPLFDSGAVTPQSNIGQSTYTSNFIIQQINETRAEKQQIIETFGEDYVYFFGEQPRFLDVRGILLNTSDFNWKSEFWTNYEQFLRGTRLVEQNARVYFYFDDIVVEGYILSASAPYSSDNPHMLPFSFQMYITNYAILSAVGSVFIPAVDSLGVANQGLEPFTTEERREAAARAAQVGSTGGLGGFLAAAGQFLDSAEFAVQEVLENMKTFFYGKRIAVPDGLDSQVVVEPVTSIARYQTPPTGRPIHEMADEYVARSNIGTPQYDDIELARVEAMLAVQDPVALDKAARAELAARGVNIEKPSEVMILLGRGAFAAIQYTAPMALGQTGGKLGVVDQGISSVL